MTPGSGKAPDRPAPASGGKTRRKRSGSNSLVEESAAKRASTEDSTDSATSRSVPRTSVAGFLNSLSAEEAQALDRVMRSALRSKLTTDSTLSDDVRQQLLAFRGMELEDGFTHDGSWWVDLCKCEIVGILSDDHPRWQVDINGAGRTSNVALVREILTAQSFSLFKATSTEGTKKVVKFNCLATMWPIMPISLVGIRLRYL